MKKYYIYGKHPVFCALNNKARKIHHVYCNKKFYSSHSNLISNFKFDIKENDSLSRILKHENHQGAIAYVDPIYLENNNLDIFEKKNILVILDQLQDSQNIGAIFRSANAFNIKNFICVKDKSPPENGLIAKSSAGCLENSTILVVNNLSNIIKILKKLGFWIIGLSNHSTQTLGNMIKLDKFAIIIGAENKGIRHNISKNCDFLVKIPISDNINSLNASNAAAIAFYHLTNIII